LAGGALSGTWGPALANGRAAAEACVAGGACAGLPRPTGAKESIEALSASTAGAHFAPWAPFARSIVRQWPLPAVSGPGYRHPHLAGSPRLIRSVLRAAALRAPPARPWQHAPRSLASVPEPAPTQPSKPPSNVRAPSEVPFKDQVSERVVEVTAEDCDHAIDHLRKLRESYDKTKYLQPQSSWDKFKRSMKGAWVATVQALRAFPKWLWGTVTMTPAQWRAAFAGAWAATKEVAHHYWVGSKLLWADIRVATRLALKVAKGRDLTRRERRQLTRTTADVFRLVPFAIFVIVPFMELLLPLALRIFPDMLPSTFQDQLKKEEEQKKRLAARLGIAHFLQDTIAEMAKDIRDTGSRDASANAGELVDFMHRVRSGKTVSNKELLKFSPLFNDQITLDNLERIHLVNMCRFLGIQPFGTDEFLRQRLRDYIRQVKHDDRMIRQEGVDSLTESELREACRARGMAAPYGPYAREFMAQQMREWLDLSLQQSIPTSLLILSRAFTLASPMTVHTKEDRSFMVIRDAIGYLPEEVVEEVEAESTRLPADGVSRAERTEAMRRKLSILKQEEEAIREEEEEIAQREQALADSILRERRDAASASAAALPPKTPQGAAEGASGGAGVDAGGASPPANAATAGAAREDGRPAPASASAVPVTPIVEGVRAAGELSEEEVAFEQLRFKQMRMRRILTALGTLASGSAVSDERERFLTLVHKEAESTLSAARSSGGQLLFQGGSLQAPRETPDQTAKALSTSLTDMLARIERDLDQVDAKLGERLRFLDKDNDGRISREELQAALQMLKEQVSEEETDQLLAVLNSEDDNTFEVRVLRALSKQAEETE